MSSQAEQGLGEGFPPFQVDVSPDRARVIVAPAGEIDLATAPRLQQAVDELLERGFTHVVVDLRRVAFLDSQGVRALFNVHNHARELGATISLIPGHGATRNTLEICGVLQELDVIG